MTMEIYYHEVLFKLRIPQSIIVSTSHIWSRLQPVDVPSLAFVEFVHTILS